MGAGFERHGGGASYYYRALKEGRVRHGGGCEWVFSVAGVRVAFAEIRVYDRMRKVYAALGWLRRSGANTLCVTTLELESVSSLFSFFRFFFFFNIY